jgi:hypothetical protein
VPWSEAHGGYTFCAVASLALLGALHECQLPALMVRLRKSADHVLLSPHDLMTLTTAAHATPLPVVMGGFATVSSVDCLSALA